MCGRYTLATIEGELPRTRFELDASLDVRRRYNVAPGDDVLTVTTDRGGGPRGELLRWGLVPAWSKTERAAPLLINARAETISERPAFRTAFERRRCLIVADGFYEWRRSTAGIKHAFHITRRDHRLFAFAGLWSVWHGDDGRRLRSCAIVTTAANSAVADLHDRMPVILPRDAEPLWLSPTAPREQLLALITTGLPAAETRLRAVGPAVNDARYDGPECLASPPTGPPAQPSLF